jgi:hypothetical protein
VAHTGTDTFRLRQKDLAWRVIEAEAIVLDNRTSRYLSVNRTGAALWQLLSEGTSYERMVSQLVEQYGVDVDRARADVELFLGDCTERGLLDGRD